MTNLRDATLGRYQARFDERLSSLLRDGIVNRIWDHDVSVWTEDPEGAAEARDRLGWLQSPEIGLSDLAEYKSFADGVREDGFQHVALLGMGGSSLCPEVFRRTFPPSTGNPKLWVLDSTDPASVLALEKSIALDKTLFIVSTKSGSTIETNSFYRYFWSRVQPHRGEETGKAFVAVTDPGSSLETEASQRGFRKVFEGPPTVGGRYSALTPFGMVPGALLGMDLRQLLERAKRMQDACRVGEKTNPGLELGALLGEMALAGRDKVTLLMDPAIESFGLWLEQLLAESLGKESKGLIPVADEPLSGPEVYGSDRLFLYLSIGEGRPDYLEQLGRLAGDGHPVARIELSDALDLGAEFYRWEFATAVAGTIFGVNAFDQPNVSESKKNTAEVLDGVRTTGRFESETPLARSGGISVFGPPDSQGGDAAVESEDRVVDAIAQWLQAVPEESYLSIQAYLPSDESVETLLQSIRVQLRDRLRVATTLGMGPRFLHSTGQLHKGGPATGVFLQLTKDSDEDLPVPGQEFNFATLIRAQALGDGRSIASRDLPFLRIHVQDTAELARIESWMDRLVPSHRVENLSE